MSNYTRGRTKEYSAMEGLETRGFECTRSAGSHGKWDIVAVNEKEIKLIQVKYGCKISKCEFEKFYDFKAPAGVSKEIWNYIKGKKDPTIMYLNGKAFEQPLQ